MRGFGEQVLFHRARREDIRLSFKPSAEISEDHEERAEADPRANRAQRLAGQPQRTVLVNAIANELPRAEKHQ